MERRFYLSIRLLPEPYFPVRILRRDAVTLQIVDPRSTKQELLAAAYDLLEPWEHEAGRRAYGQPPPGWPMDEELVTGYCLPFVPESIRVPGEPAIQSPLFHTPELRQALHDALDWSRMEQALQVAS